MWDGSSKCLDQLGRLHQFFLAKDQNIHNEIVMEDRSLTLFSDGHEKKV